MMDLKTQQKLIDLNSHFYASVASSFSETRQNAWQGWKKSLEILQKSEHMPHEFDLFDVACGNLRFEKFLSEKGLEPKVALCVDNCEMLLPEDAPCFVHYKKLDLFSENIEHTADLVVCFGFMHHIPTYERRKSFLNMLMKNVRDGGCLVLSFWQFMKDERIAKKANVATSKFDMQLDEEDYLLGWKDEADVFRYCHNFTDDEIAALIKGWHVVAQFSEDGKAHNLNKYVILKKL